MIKIVAQSHSLKKELTLISIDFNSETCICKDQETGEAHQLDLSDISIHFVGQY